MNCVGKCGCMCVCVQVVCTLYIHYACLQCYPVCALFDAHPQELFQSRNHKDYLGDVGLSLTLGQTATCGDHRWGVGGGGMRDVWWITAYMYMCITLMTHIPHIHVHCHYMYNLTISSLNFLNLHLLPPFPK